MARGGAARCLFSHYLLERRELPAACVHGKQLRSVKKKPKRYVGARDKRTVPEAKSLTELVRGVFYGLMSCQVSGVSC